MKRSSPVILQHSSIYNDINEEIMYTGPSPSGNNDRNLTPLSRHRPDEGS
jgi:hypothetical protein